MRAVTAACVLAMLACASCRTAGLGVFDGDDDDVCADAVDVEDGGAFACDGESLVACTGKAALTKKGGLHVCTQLDDAGFMIVCTKGPHADRFEVELLPCAACTSDEALGVVDFGLEACRLPPAPEAPPGDDEDDVPLEDAGPGLFKEDDEAVVETTSIDAAFQPCPCDDAFVCDRDLDVCVPRDACSDEYSCDDGERCVIDDEGEPVCVRGG